jgi:hypothetical protein
MIITSILTGIFSDKLLKIAKICPIFKSGDRDCFANYRPISVLPSYSKFVGKVIFNKIMHYIDSKHILTNSQYGFRKEHSTLMAIVEIRAAPDSVFLNPAGTGFGRISNIKIRPEPDLAGF